MEVKVAKVLDDDDVMKREEEEQKVIEAKIKSRLKGFGDEDTHTHVSNNHDDHNDHNDNSLGDENEDTADTNHSFGSNLDREMRMRSRSLSTENPEGSGGAGVIAMSPEERRALEREMSSQSDHPLMRQMQLEAERESQRHVLDHMNRRSDRRRASREQFERLMNWTARNARDRQRAAAGFDPDNPEDNHVTDGLNNGPNANDTSTPGMPSINDLLMLEAAMYLSMREENSRSRRRNRSSRSGGRGLLFRGGRDNEDDEDQPESVRERYHERERERDRMEAAHLFQSLLRDRMMSDGPDPMDPFSMPPTRDENYNAMSDRLLSELSEARQMEMAIQLSLQEAQERDRAQAEEAAGTEEAGETSESHEENNEENTNTNTNGIDEENANDTQEVISDANENTDDHEVVNPETTTEENEGVAVTSMTTGTYDEVNIGNDIDHGEEEIVFDRNDDDDDGDDNGQAQVSIPVQEDGQEISPTEALPSIDPSD
eukprot:CAMPEP_0204617464 /NCGR_PEP_ID=MMETSP0717-20131115/4434_1 /ASSEMBLY_ACC=CAM_ASM_000666 /TAXON_ID=230516 /ORGANISM="Chaetoceros curvisetus" /LENGTH=486 /DNA_ID=CAMNT_0051631011 /DNA_START=498 /DNA_END=1958 /DNA_ORIENTATION=+